MTAAISCTVRSAMEHRSRPQRRLAASLKAVSDWMPRVVVAFADVISSPGVSADFMTTVLLPMGLFSCRRGASVGCVELQELIQCVNGDLNVFAFENVRRQKAKNSIAGS